MIFIKELEDRFRKVIYDNQLFVTKDVVVIGVSGGPDSLALLLLMLKFQVELDLKIVVAHLNHGFRQEAEEEALYVEKLCKEYNLIIEVKRVSVPEFMEKERLGAQEAARKVRYLFYEEILNKYNAKKLVLAHHADDQAETVLMRLLRGSGPAGISGMSMVKKIKWYTIIRPLLNIHKSELEEYCHYSHVTPQMDQSNYSKKYFRNRIRLEIIPFLQKYEPQIISHLNQFADIMREENQLIWKLAENALREMIISHDEDEVKISLDRFLKNNIAIQRRILHLLLNKLKNSTKEISFHHIDIIIKEINSAKSTTTLNLPTGILFQKQYKQLIFSKKNIINNDYTYLLQLPGLTHIPEINKGIIATITDSLEGNPTLTDAVFDFAELKGELQVRTRKKGEIIKPLGLKGSKKVKELFIDAKIPKLDRESYPIITYQNEILWIPGVVRSNIALINEKTEKFLSLKLIDL